MPLLMKAKEAAQELGVGADTFAELVREGRIDFVMVGARRYFTSDHLESFVRNQTRRSMCSISEKVHRIGTTGSRSVVVNFEALRELAIKNSQRRSQKN